MYSFPSPEFLSILKVLNDELNIIVFVTFKDLKHASHKRTVWDSQMNREHPSPILGDRGIQTLCVYTLIELN